MLDTKHGRLVDARGLVDGEHAATGRHQTRADVVVAVVLAAWAILLLSGYLVGAAS